MAAAPLSVHKFLALRPAGPRQLRGRRAISVPASIADPTRTAENKASLYQVLKVRETATPAEIKSAYRSLAKRVHPDIRDRETDGQDFIAIHEAYSTLSDPAAKAQYDQSMGRSSFRFGGFSAQSISSRRPMNWETDQFC